MCPRSNARSAAAGHLNGPTGPEEIATSLRALVPLTDSEMRPEMRNNKVRARRKKEVVLSDLRGMDDPPLPNMLSRCRRILKGISVHSNKNRTYLEQAEPSSCRFPGNSGNYLHYPGTRALNNIPLNPMLVKHPGPRKYPNSKLFMRNTIF